MKFPPGFIPPPPCHPTLRVVTEQQILNRVGRLMVNGDREAAIDILHALARARNYPRPVTRASIQLTILEKQ